MLLHSTDCSRESGKEISISVNTRCLPGGESNTQINNNNAFPIYFKVLATDVIGMCFRPLEGKVDSHSTETVRGYRVQSAQKIEPQQKVAIMVSRLPLYEWPEDEFYQPIASNQNQASESQFLSKRSEEFQSPGFRRYTKPDKTLCCLKNSWQCKGHYRDNTYSSSNGDQQHYTSAYQEYGHKNKSNSRNYKINGEKYKNNGMRQNDNLSPRSKQKGARSEFARLAFRTNKSKGMKKQENHCCETSENEGHVSTPNDGYNFKFKRKEGQIVPEAETKAKVGNCKVDTGRKTGRILKENFNISIICHCESCCDYYKALQLNSNGQNSNQEKKSKDRNGKPPQADNSVTTGKEESSSQSIDSSTGLQNNGIDMNSSIVSDDSAEDSETYYDSLSEPGSVVLSDRCCGSAVGTEILFKCNAILRQINILFIIVTFSLLVGCFLLITTFKNRSTNVKYAWLLKHFS